MAPRSRHYVRQMPRIYGDLQQAPKPVWNWVRFAGRLAVIFGVGGYILYSLFFGPAFRVKTVTVNGAAFSSAAADRAAVPAGSNIWLLSSAQIRQRVMADPAVLSVDVLRGLPHSVTLQVSEQRVAAVWQTGSDAALVNAQGTAFDVLPQSGLSATNVQRAIAGAPVIIDSKNLPVASGQALLAPQFISFVDTVQSALHATVPSLDAEHFLVGDTTYSVTLLTRQGMQIQFSTLDDPNVQLRNLQRLITQESLPANAQVDLRVNRWAYVHE